MLKAKSPAPTPDSVATGFESSATTKLADAEEKRKLADSILRDPGRAFGRDRDASRAVERLRGEAKRLCEEAQVEALLALCARVAEVSR